MKPARRARRACERAFTAGALALVVSLGTVLPVGAGDPVGEITEFTTGLTPNGGPSRIATGPDGNLWFTEAANPGRIARITPSGVITEFTTGLTPDSQPVGITAGPDDNVWFTQAADPGRVAKIGAGCIPPVPPPAPAPPVPAEPRFTG
jgi:streptogramin lyase